MALRVWGYSEINMQNTNNYLAKPMSIIDDKNLKQSTHFFEGQNKALLNFWVLQQELILKEDQQFL